ncbi:MAG: DJ-1/PfpI family protein [Thermodesulfobacteriota bacterium]
MNVGIYIYEQAEVLDFSGPFEVFSTASRFLQEDEKFNVFLVSEAGNTVAARGGFSVNPKYGFHNHPQLDVLIIAGGVHTKELEKELVIDWIRSKSKNAKLVASVCTGVFLLAQAGIVVDHSVTTHWEDIPDLRRSYPGLHVKESKRWVAEANIVTSAGISAGIDMSLYLVSKLHSQTLAEKTARQMEFDWAGG